MAASAGVTALDIITEALSVLGVYSQGESLSAADSASALFTLTALMDGWGAENFTIYNEVIQQFSTTASKQSYTIGPDNTNDWITATLPPSFDRVGNLPVTNGQPMPLELPVQIYTLDMWASIALKGLQSSIIQAMYPNYGFPSHTLNFWPIPNVVIPVSLYYPQKVAKLTALANAVAMPPGYQEALTYELAIKCAAKFGATIPQFLPDAWAEAKAKIKSMNTSVVDAICDPALVRRGTRTGYGSLGFYTGE
jgi:hypothetical protein